MPVYQPGIPTGTINLDVDYQNIQNNFTQLDVCFDVDHVTFSNTSAQTGYHKSIHFNPVSTTVTNVPNNYVTATQYPQGVPATVAGIGQLFSSQVNDAINIDTGLYWLTGAGRQIALTRNIAPTLAANGRTFLPGGLILQWGTFIITVAATGLVFTWPFPFTTFYSATLSSPNASLGGSRIPNFLNTPTNLGGTVYLKNDNNVLQTGSVFFMAIGV
jgi:hypothetical protein